MRVKTTVGELYVEESGEGPALVLWHSFLHHGGMWRGQLEALRRRHRVLNIDAPGHGRSERWRAPLSMPDCASAVREILDSRRIERAAFVGLSWGGMVAMQLAIESPARLWAMALFDTSCRRETLKNRVEYALLGRLFRTLGAVPSLMRRVEPMMFGAHSLRRRPPIIDEWSAYVGGLDRESVWEALQCIAHRRDVSADLARVRVPTLVAVGAQDRAQPAAQSEAIARAIPGARLVRIADAGHLSALERPDLVNPVLTEFLQAHASA